MQGVLGSKIHVICNWAGRDLSGIFVGWAKGPSNKNSMGPKPLTLAGGLGAARLPVGSRGNALVRGPGELCSPAEIRFAVYMCLDSLSLDPFFLFFIFIYQQS